MNIVEDLVCNGWIFIKNKNEIDLYVDYKRNINDPNTLSILKILHYIKCNECGKKLYPSREEEKLFSRSEGEKKIVNKQDKLITELLIDKNDNYNKILKNEYILIFNNELLSQLPIELRNIDRILPLIKLFIQNKLKYQINIHQNYLTLKLEYRLYNILNKVEFHLLNSKIYECFKLYTNLALTLNTYKSDLIKQNEFEDIRRRLLLLNDLGAYEYLKNKLNNKLHKADFIKRNDDENENTCCKVWC